MGSALHRMLPNQMYCACMRRNKNAVRDFPSGDRVPGLIFAL